MRARYCLLVVPIVLTLSTSCAGTSPARPAASPAAAASANAGLSAADLHDADTKLRALLEAGLAPQTRGKDRFVMGGIDQVPKSLEGTCPAGETRDNVEETLFSRVTDPASAPAAEAALTARGLVFAPWVVSPRQPRAHVAIARPGDFVVEVVQDLGPDVEVVGWTPCLKGRLYADATIFPVPSHGA